MKMRSIQTGTQKKKSKGTGSYFQKWIEHVISEGTVYTSSSTVVSCNIHTNKRFGPVFLAKLQKLLLPTFPLWSNVLVGDLSRHGSSESYRSYKPHAAIITCDKYRSETQPTTGTSTIEE